jgi:DNA-directed RNA polymerase specialized sigma24 family protein
MTSQNWSDSFEQAVLPHLDAAYNFARWLTRNEQDAEDIVQEAYLRAFRFFPSFREMPRSLTRTFFLRILARLIQNKLHCKTTAARCCEMRWRSFRRVFVNSSFCASSKG